MVQLRRFFCFQNPKNLRRSDNAKQRKKDDGLTRRTCSGIIKGKGNISCFLTAVQGRKIAKAQNEKPVNYIINPLILV